MTNKIKVHNKNNNTSIQDILSSNPITQGDLVAKLNNLSNGLKATKGSSRSLVSSEKAPSLRIDYPELIKLLNSAVQKATTANKLFSTIHTSFIRKIGGTFTAIGFINKQSKCLNLRLLDKNSIIYSSRVFLNDKSNEIIKAIENDSVLSVEDNSFLKIPHVQNSPSIIIPLKNDGKVVGVMVVGDHSIANHISMYELIASYFGLFYHNNESMKKVFQNSTMDNLTNLYSHRRFQELLTDELNTAKENDSALSVLIFDINEISQINKEFGHSKGDEVIKLVAEKISQNLRKQDIAGRYGGDEIGVILPGMDTNEAKYLAEYITYVISCTFIDDVGPVKVSVGLATYPTDATDREKLLILTEQGVFVSRSKGYKNGTSTIVSVQDYDFWDDASLNSFASVIAKRHSQIGINFEESLLDKFKHDNTMTKNHIIEIVTSLAGAIDAKDEYTKDHSASVSRYAVALAKAINLPTQEIERIRLGALLHDIGKIGIPENILRKPAQLTEEEWAILRQHPAIGADKILMPNPALHDLIPIVKYHHERWDGKGYPEGLKGEEIPLAARIVSIADSYHALISDRPYRKGLSIDKACQILEDEADKQWDKELVRQFVQIAESLGTMI